MINETFVEKNLWINTIHPSLRVTAAILLASVIAMSNEIITLVISLATAVLVILNTNLRVILVFKRLIAPLSFLLFIWVILPFSDQSEVYNNVLVTKTGTTLALKITFKTISISLFSILFIGTMKLDTLCYSLRFLNVPKKMVTIISITYRYIFLIEQEYIKLLQAIKLRGFKPTTSIHTYKTYSYVVGILIVRAHIRAKNIYNAMICRSFNGEFFTLKIYTFNWQSYVFTILTILLITILFFFEVKS